MMKNPYIDSSGNPQMLDSFVCYADILGYKGLSKESLANKTGSDYLNQLWNALKKAYTEIREEQWGGETSAFELKVFTDNIVVGYPIANSAHRHEDGEVELGDIIRIFSRYQAFLSMNGFFIRGGIARGLHYMDDDIVFGDALLEAIELDKSGGPPRLLLANSAIQAIKEQAGSYPDSDVIEPMNHYYLSLDSDDNVFVNYLLEAFQYFFDGGVIFFDLLEKHRDNIIKGFEKYKSSPDVRAKYEWILIYHNFVCKQFSAWHPIPTNPDVDKVYAASCYEAQKALNYLIDVELFYVSPREFNLDELVKQKGHLSKF